MSEEEQPILTPRHWAVLGIVRLTRGPISPEKLAEESRFTTAAVQRLLKDLAARGYYRPPTTDESS